MRNQVQFGRIARERIVEGVNIAADTVRPTLGAKGRNVIIQMPQGGSLSTNDGVTALRQINLADNVQQMGVGLVREGAAKSEEIAGDGTTTVSILIQALVNEGMKYITAGASAVDLKRGMKLASEDILKMIDEDAITIDKDSDMLKSVATVSANNDPDLGGLISELFKTVGKDGIIDIQDSNDNTTKIEIVDGAEYDRGYLSPYFTNNATNDKAIFENPYVLVTDHRLNSFRDILPILDKVNKKAPVLIVSDEIDPDVMRTIVLNASQRIIDICCIKAPEIGDLRIDHLRDIAAITGATYISSGMNMELGEDVTEDMLGRCDKIVVDEYKTKLIGGHGEDEEIEKAINSIRERLKNETDSFKKSKLEQRLARLTGGVAVFFVGAPTETELEEKKMRLDDSLKATRASLSGGIVPGGGILLAGYSSKIKPPKELNPDEAFGYKIVSQAILAPFHQIMDNAGYSGDVILNRVMKQPKHEGFDVKDGEYCNLVKKGIVDPADVTRAAIQNSVSIASMILTTEVLISDIETDE